MIEILISALGIALLAWVYSSHKGFKNSILKKRTSQNLSEYPSVTVIRPIKDLDFGIRENVTAALDHGYPGEVETIFVFDDSDEPAYPIVVQEILNAQKREPKCDAKIIFSGNPPKGRTGKLNAMIAGYKFAKYDLVGFADSDIRQDRDTLKILVETLLTTPNAGSSFTPVYAASDIETFGDTGYSLMLNGLYGSAVALTALKNKYRFDFIMGQFMVFKREAIEAIGGLQSASGQLVDDMYIGKLVYNAGYDNIMAPKTMPIIQKGINASEFWKIYVKWLTFSRTGLDWSFKLSNMLRGVQFFVGFLVGVLLAYLGYFAAATVFMASAVAVSISISSLHTLLGGHKIPFRHFWTPFMLMLTVPFVLLSVLRRRKVTWRGRTYELNAKSSLATGTVVPAGTNGFAKTITKTPLAAEKRKDKQI